RHLERSQNISKDLVWIAVSINSSQKQPTVVVLDERRSLIVVRLQSWRNHFFLIVGARHERRAAKIADISFFRRGELDVIRRVALFVGANPPPGDSFDNEALVDLQVDDDCEIAIELFEQGIKTARLRNVARKTVENEALLTLRGIELF